MLDDLVMTAEQRTNLKFLMHLGTSPSEALGKVFQEQTFLVEQFFSGTNNSKKDVRMLRMIPGVKGLPPVEMKRHGTL